MTYIPSNDARNAPHDAVVKMPGGGVKGFNRYWTARAVRLLRRLQNNPFVKQARHDNGSTNALGHGSVCANQALIEFLDNLRNADNGSFAPIDRILPVNSNEIIRWNDQDKLSFAEIAQRIEQRAGGPEALADA